MRKLINPHQKAALALAAAKGDQTLSQLASDHQVHPSQLSEWKHILERGAHQLFGPGGKTHAQHTIDELRRMIGKREEELEWLKKKLHLPDAPRKESAH